MAYATLDKAITQVKQDLPETFKLNYIIAEENTGKLFNGGHLKSLQPRIDKLYKKVKKQIPNKPIFNRYLNTIFGTSFKDMKSNLFYSFRDVLDTKLEQPLDNFISLCTPVEYVQIGTKIIPIYNKENTLYIKLSDCDVFNTTPLEFLNKSGVVAWKTAKFKSNTILLEAVENGGKFWKYLAKLNGVRHHLALYQLRGLSIDRVNKIAYFPRLRSTSAIKDVYFGKQKYWYEPLAHEEEDVYINLNRFRQFLYNYKKSPEEIKYINNTYDAICSDLFSGTNFACLESYYTVPYNYVQGFFSYRSIILDTITSKVRLVDTKINKYLLRRAASMYVSNIIFPETETISYNEWAKDTYIEGMSILKNINKNIKEAVVNVRKNTRNWSVCDTSEC